MLEASIQADRRTRRNEALWADDQIKSENWTPPRQNQIDDFDTTFDPACHGTGGPVQNGYSHYNYPQNRERLPAVDPDMLLVSRVRCSVGTNR